MNVQDYRAAGYKLSTHVEQPIITRAESDVVAAYIIPLCGIAPTEDERAAEQEQMTIDELEIENSADNPEQNEVSKEATEQSDAVEEVILNEDSDDEPSAEDDIIDVD